MAAEVIKFGRNVISVSTVFLQTQLSYAFTNRKPIVPGRILERWYYPYSTASEPELQMHEIRAVESTLGIPIDIYGIPNVPNRRTGGYLTRRVVPRFSALTPHEVSDLFTSVHRIAPVVEKLFNATSLTIAIQVKYSSSCNSVHVCMMCYWSHACTHSTVGRSWCWSNSGTCTCTCDSKKTGRLSTQRWHLWRGVCDVWQLNVTHTLLF